MKPSPESSPLEIYLLGLVDFEEVQQVQRKLIYELGERQGASLILCEREAGLTSCPTTTTCGPTG